MSWRPKRAIQRRSSTAPSAGSSPGRAGGPSQRIVASMSPMASPSISRSPSR